MSDARPATGKPRLPHPDADHYLLEGNGRPLPRATTVIERGIGKPFLTAWAARLERESVLQKLAATLEGRLPAAEIQTVLDTVEKELGKAFACDVYKDDAAAFGTDTHAVLERYLRERAGLPPGDSAPSESTEVKRASDLAIEWLEAIAFEPDPAGIEERLWSEDERLWSAGTVDAFGSADLTRLLANSQWNRKFEVEAEAGARVPLVVDWKTSNSVGVTHKVQIGAYLTFLMERSRIEEPCYACILRVARSPEDASQLEALLIHPAEFARYGGAFRLLRRMYNFLSQEEDLERTHWRSRRRAARASGGTR